VITLLGGCVATSSILYVLDVEVRIRTGRVC
jgi:hypothetical protein